MLALVLASNAHVQLDMPKSRTNQAGPAGAGLCPDGACFWFSQGCQPGCLNCTDTFENDGNCAGGSESEPTVQGDEYRTYQDYHGYDWTRHNPWRSPGLAPVLSPCGLAGGGPTDHPSNGATAKHTSAPQGYDARLLKSGPVTEWARGSTQEVGWSIVANHGGGYAYRLCPKASGRVDEACFQAGHLALDGNTSWVQRGDDVDGRVPIPAMRLSVGTHPQGAQWTRNPIPACNGTSGGVGEGFNCSGASPQFAPPIPGLYGYGTAECFAALGGDCTDKQSEYLHKFFNFMIVDRVVVPAHLPAGEYVLSFRYDAEQTPQVWANCADLRITESAAVEVEAA